MSSAARYLIAQYTPDLFRREPRNVGVLVDKGGNVAARFFGEVMPGEVDGRKLRGFDYPDVYRQWVEYWRDQLNRGQDGIMSVIHASRDHYRIVEGGELTDTGDDDPSLLADYLFSLLVSDGGFAEAIALAEETEGGDARKIKLADEVEQVFKGMSILAGGDSDLLVRHPIQRQVPLQGRAVDVHRPDYMQENGRIYVMGVVDFNTSRTAAPRERAGRTAYMFTDLRNAHTTLNPISIVRLPEDGYENEDVFYGMKMLQAESDVVVWTDPDQRATFIQERRQVAMATA